MRILYRAGEAYHQISTAYSPQKCGCRSSASWPQDMHSRIRPGPRRLFIYRLTVQMAKVSLYSYTTRLLRLAVATASSEVYLPSLILVEVHNSPAETYV